MGDITCDIAIIGGSLGGVAAALAAAEAGKRVMLSEATDWLGGQVSSQGVAPLDEHPFIESFGGTRRYREFRQRVREHYQRHCGAPERMPDGQPLNPGNGWVSRLCFEPRVGLKVLYAMLEPHLHSGRLRVLLEHAPVAAEVRAAQVTSVTLRHPAGVAVTVRAAYFLDATDLGELLPLTRTAFVTGAEASADTGEPSARAQGANPQEVQSFTYSFAVEYRPGERHLIAKPGGYSVFRRQQPYSLTIDRHTAKPKRFRMFARGPNGELPFWTYRRLADAKLLRHESNDLALINWASNDYRLKDIISASVAERDAILAEAKRLSLGFLHWLQTECPRDGGGRGYPELMLRPDVMGTEDGLSKAPYIRESRRILALERILEQDISASPEKGARARPHANSVGIGWYQMDLHPCVGNDEVSVFSPTLPFQLPLGALIPKATRNLLAACKNIGTTHLSNGAYRLHPTEWAIGEAAGTLAAFCLSHALSPRALWKDAAATRELQLALLGRGVPLAWTTDVPPEHPWFLPAQLLVLAGAIQPGSARYHSLELDLEAPLGASERAALMAAARRISATASPSASTWRAVCEALAL